MSEEMRYKEDMVLRLGRHITQNRSVNSEFETCQGGGGGGGRKTSNSSTSCNFSLTIPIVDSLISIMIVGSILTRGLIFLLRRRKNPRVHLPSEWKQSRVPKQ